MKKRMLLLFAFVFINTCGFAQCVIEMNTASCDGTNANIIIVTGEFYDEYQWYYKPIVSTGDFQMIDGATNPSLTFDWATYNNTLIKLHCIYDFGMSYFSNTLELDILDCNLGVPEKPLSQLRLSPNPVKDDLMLDGFEELDKIEIFNAMGQIVFTSTDSNPVKINASSFAAGVYILKAHSQNNSKQLRSIKS